MAFSSPVTYTPTSSLTPPPTLTPTFISLAPSLLHRSHPLLKLAQDLTADSNLDPIDNPCCDLIPPLKFDNSSFNPSAFLKTLGSWMEDCGLCITAIPTKKTIKTWSRKNRAIREVKNLQCAISYEKKAKALLIRGSNSSPWLYYLGRWEASRHGKRNPNGAPEVSVSHPSML